MNPIDDDQSAEPLSPAGMQRRGAMLQDLVGDMERLHRRRRVRRRMTTAATIPALLITTIGLWWLTAPRSGTTPILVKDKVASTRAPADHSTDIARSDSPAALIVRVHTDPTIVDRWKVSATVSARSFVVDDDALLAALSEIDRPAGLIRSEGRVWLTEPVTDEARNVRPQGS